MKVERAMGYWAHDKKTKGNGKRCQNLLHKSTQNLILYSTGRPVCIGLPRKLDDIGPTRDTNCNPKIQRRICIAAGYDYELLTS